METVNKELQKTNPQLEVIIISQNFIGKLINDNEKTFKGPSRLSFLQF